MPPPQEPHDVSQEE
jgi:hypothetical protein